MTLQNVKFAFLSHEVEGATGFPENFATYLQQKGAKLTYIKFPFFHSYSKSIWVERWDGVKLLSRKRSIFRFYRPQLLSFAKDFFWLMTVGWYYVAGSDFVLVSNNMNGLAALIFRKIGLIKSFSYLIVDYSPRRFSQGPVEKLYVFLDKLVAKNADSVWTMSLAMLEGRERDGRFNVSDVKYRLAPMGNNAHVTFSHGEIPFKRRDLVFVGNPNAKNVRADLLLDVASLLSQQTDDFRLIFVGPGETAHLKKRTEQLGLNHNVIFKGSIPDTLDLERFMAGCGIGLAPYDPTLKDNFSKYADPSKIKVYLGCSLPIITTAVPPISKDLEETGSGVIAEFSAEAFAEKILFLWRHHDSYDRARKAALDFGRQFSWPKIFDRLAKEEGWTIE